MYPIPGQGNELRDDLPTDDLTLMASERAGNMLTPYEERFGLKPINPPEAKSIGAKVGQAMVSTEDKLYHSIHPETFSKVLEMIMQVVTGKPIPRQRGGGVEPGEEYIVGEEGPERFRPNIPGEIIPMGRRRLTYAGQEEPYREMQGIGPQAYRAIRGMEWESPWESPYEPTGPKFQIPGAEKPIDMVREPSGVYVAGGGGEGFKAPPYTGPRPVTMLSWRNRPIPPPVAGGEGVGGWKDFDEGIRYKLGPEDIAGDEAARKRILAEAGGAAERYGIPTPSSGGYLDEAGRIRVGAGPGYYDVHPEERFMDMAAADNRELMERYRRAGPKERAILARMMEANLKTPAEYYKAGLEYGPYSPASQERLAHAEYYRQLPGLETYRVSEQGRTHLEGINRQVAGHIAAAKIAAEVKDPIMKEIGTVLTQGQKMAELYGTPFDPTQAISQVLKIYRALGQITNQQWNALPDEYKGIRKLPDFETFKSRAKTQGSKMSERALKEAYDKLSRGGA